MCRKKVFRQSNLTEVFYEPRIRDDVSGHPERVRDRPNLWRSFIPKLLYCVKMERAERESQGMTSDEMPPPPVRPFPPLADRMAMIHANKATATRI